MERIASIPLSRRAADAIRESILRGDYAQGQKLSEMECAESLGLSRICVREAFALLVAEGLLQKSVNRCTTVIDFDDAGIRDLHNLRLALEQMCVRLCVENGALPLGELSASIDHMRAFAQSDKTDHMDFLREDLRFHEALITASGSPRAASIWRGLEGQIVTLLSPVVKEYLARHKAAYTIKEHALLKSALENGDLARINELLERHILLTSQTLIELRNQK